MRLLIHDYAGHPFQIQLSRELARRGHSVVHAFAGGLLTPRGSLGRKENDSASFEIVEIPMNPNYRRDKYRFFRRRRMELDYGRKIAALIEEKHPRVVISGNTPTEPQLTIANTCSRLGISLIPWVQDFYCIAVSMLAKKRFPLLGHFIGSWYLYLERKALRQAAAIVSITEDFVPILARFGISKGRVTVIPNWAPLEELPLRPRCNSWSAARGLNDKFVFLYSGTLAMKHNPDLLRQLAVCFRHDPEVRLVVISEGPGADFLISRKTTEALDNLQILPFQSFTEMPAVLASADVLAAVLEPDAGVFSVPSKVLTYHCAGKPILGAFPGSNLAARIITTEGTGICVDPQDITGFLQGAQRLRQNRNLAETYGLAARAYAEKTFLIDRITDGFQDVLNRVCPQPELLSI